MGQTPRTFLAAAAILAGLALGGCSPSSADPGLSVAGVPYQVSVAAGRIAPGQPVSFGSIILCLEKHGLATVVGVKLVGGQGSMRLDAFGVRPNPFPRHEPGIGANRDHLVDLGFGLTAPQVVDSICPSPSELEAWSGGSELAVEMSYSDPKDPGSSESLEVTYSDASSETHTLIIDYGDALPRCVPRSGQRREDGYPVRDWLSDTRADSADG
jgi:hypothetical protein